MTQDIDTERMPRIPVALAYTSQQARHGQDGAARVVNMYAEEIGEGGKTKVALYAIDGMSRFATLTGAGIRAMLAVSDDELYAVAGRVIHRVDSGGSGTVMGGLVSDGYVTMARNRRAVPQIMMTCDGTTVMIQGGVYSDFTDSDLPPANSVCSHNGYFVWTHFDGRISYSSPDDSAVDALDFVTANASADALLIGFSRGADLLLFGQRTIEAWQYTGDPVFSRTTTVQMGCLSPASVTDIDATVGFVAHDGTIRILNGYTAERISNHAIERKIASDSSPTTIRGYGWSERGHRFMGFTGSNWSAVYDLTTGLWHERTSKNATRWRCGAATQFGTKRIFGHISSPYLFQSNSSLHTEDGDEIACINQSPPIHGFADDVAMNGLHIDMIPGVGLTSGSSQDTDPRIMLDYSDDGGDTWSAQRFLPIGKAHQRLTKVSAYRLGTVPHTGRIIRTTTTASVVRALLQMQADVTPLRG